MGGGRDPGQAQVEALRKDRRRSLRMRAQRGIEKPNVKVAETPDEFDAAFRLAHDVYVEMGYSRPHPSGLRVLLHQTVPGNLVFLARDERFVLGTVTLIPDGLLGLPMDDIYRGELGEFRDRGRRIAEVSALAVDSRYRWLLIDEDGRRRGVFWLLHQAVLYYALRTGIHHLVITVNPRHAPFYERLYLFERFGEVKSYGTVQGAPAVPLHLDLTRLPERLDRAVAESERMFGLATFFFRLEHGFFQGEDDLPGMDPPTARYFLSRSGALDSVPRALGDAFARAHGFRDLDEFLSAVPEPRLLPCSRSASP